MGAIKKRGNIWWIRYFRVGTDGKSHRIEESAHTTNPNEARALLRQREGARATGASVQTVRRERVTFDQAAQLVIAKYESNQQRSIADVRRNLEHLRRVFGGAPLVTVTGSDWLRYAAARREAGASNATVNRERSALVLAFNLADVPRPKLERFREAKPRRGFFEWAQFEAVVRNLPEDRADVVRFAYLTGWRRGEFLGSKKAGQEPLALRSVSFEGRGEVRIEDTKNDKPRVFPLTVELRDVLLRCRDRVRALEKKLGRIIPYVFVRPDGAPIRGFRKAWAKACKAAGVPGRTLHDFRRTAVRNLERAGVVRSVAMDMIGHKTETVHRRYGIVSRADLDTAAECLDRAAQAALQAVQKATNPRG